MKISAQLNKENNFWNKELYQIDKRRRKLHKNLGKNIYGTSEYHNQLFLKWKNENCYISRNELIETQLLLVEKYVNELVNRYGSGGLDPRDFIQEGNMALLDALDSFNPTMGNFSSYVRINLMKFILPFLKKNSHIIRHPETILKEITKENKAIEEFIISHGRLPETGEHYEYLQKNGDTYKTIKRKFGSTKLETIVSGNISINDDESANTELFEILPCIEDENYIDSYVLENLKKSLSLLNQIEHTVIKGVFEDDLNNQQISHNLFPPKTKTDYDILSINSKNTITIVYKDNTVDDLIIYCNNYNYKPHINQKIQFNLFKTGLNVIEFNINKPVLEIKLNNNPIVFEDNDNKIKITAKLKAGFVLSPQKVSNVLNSVLLKLRKNKNIQKIKKYLNE